MAGQSPPCPHLNNVGARGQTVVLREIGEVELLQDRAIGAVRGTAGEGDQQGIQCREAADAAAALAVTLAWPGKFKCSA